MITKEKFNKIKEYCKNIPFTPWRTIQRGKIGTVRLVIDEFDVGSRDYNMNDEYDQKYIEKQRNEMKMICEIRRALPKLINEIEKLNKINDFLKKENYNLKIKLLTNQEEENDSQGL